jgi:hypothetical protein
VIDFYWKETMMKKCVIYGIAMVIALVGFSYVNAAGEKDAEVEKAIEEAIASLDEYMLAFNSRDPKAWAATLNFPHVRIASGSVRVWETEQEYADYMDFDAFADRFGWDHSHWLERNVVTASKDKVHFATVFRRFNDKNEPIATFNSMYIVTKIDGHWGTQARSSFAP